MVHLLTSPFPRPGSSPLHSRCGVSTSMGVNYPRQVSNYPQNPAEGMQVREPSSKTVNLILETSRARKTCKQLFYSKEAIINKHYYSVSWGNAHITPIIVMVFAFYRGSHFLGIATIFKAPILQMRLTKVIANEGSEPNHLSPNPEF